MLSIKQDDQENPERQGCNSVTYIHRKGDENGSPFYVGVGTKRRAYEVGRNRRSDHWHRTANKYGVYVEIYREGLCREEAFALEIELIKKYGRVSEGGILVNHTDGGDGAGLGNSNAANHTFVPDRNFKAEMTLNQTKPVVNVDTNMIYPSAAIAARRLGNIELRPHISKVCKGKRNTCGGFRWKYA